MKAVSYTHLRAHETDSYLVCRLPLTPQQESLSRTQPLVVDLADGETQDECPYQAEDDLAIAVDDVLGPNICELYLPPLDEVQRDIDILETLHPQLRPRRISPQ